MKQANNDVVIFGVGRSGTTALFKYLTRAYTLLEQTPDIRYEPFLWDLKGKKPFRDSFFKTSDHSMHGLYAHTRAPLFTRATDIPALNTFVSDLAIEGSPSLVKFIRACGRIDYFLDAWPNAKFVYIFRNPCSVIQSVLPMFDFFGSEFHPSDKYRFPAQADIDEAEFHRSSYPQKQLQYWRAMNDAALLSSQTYPDRILPISQEALMVDPKKTLKTISDFCFGEENVSDEFMSALADNEKPRPLSFRFNNLPIEDYRAFNRQLDWYLSTLQPTCRSGVNVDKAALRKALDEGWLKGGLEERPGFEDPDRETSPLMLRNKMGAMAKDQEERQKEHEKSQKEHEKSQKEHEKSLQKLAQAYQDLNQLKIEMMLDQNARVTFKTSVMRRVGVALKVILEKPIRWDKGGQLLIPMTYSQADQLPEELKWKTSKPLNRLSLYFKCVFGGSIVLEKYFEDVSLEVGGKVMMKRSGPFLRRVFASLKFLVRSRVRTRKFDYFIARSF